MSLFHKHKWEYLSKEYSEIETEKSHSIGYVAMGYTSETETQHVTYIKSFCKRCGEFKVVTVKGKLTTSDLVKTGMLGKGDE